MEGRSGAWGRAVAWNEASDGARREGHHTGEGIVELLDWLHAVEGLIK